MDTWGHTEDGHPGLWMHMGMGIWRDGLLGDTRMEGLMHRKMGTQWDVGRKAWEKA